MKSTPCPGQAERERAAAGGLVGAALARFERHVETCAACATALSDGAELRVLREAALPRMDPFAERRVRAAVLRGEPPRPPPRPAVTRRNLALGGCAAALAIALLTLWVTRGRALEPRAREALGNGQLGMRSEVSVKADVDADFRRETLDDVERLVLRSGRVDIVVPDHKADKRFVVHTPDGEIEDLGTVFAVVVRGERTEHISVSRGAVVFRRPGHADLRLEAGAAYDAPVAAVTSAPSIPVDRPEPSAASAASGTSAPPPPSIASAPRSSSASVIQTRPPGGAPREGSDLAEDSAYLRVLALLREGRNEEARVAAREYLARFPNGFRRVEVTRIAN